MNKAQLANQIYEFLKQNGVEIHVKNNKTGYNAHKPVTRSLAEELLQDILVLCTQVIAVGGKISLPELGTFTVLERKARTAHNPKTLEKIKVPKHKVVKYRMSKQIKEVVNNL